MADYLVTGIAPTGDAAQVSQMLAGSGLSEANLSIVSKSSAQVQMGGGGQLGGPSFNAASTIMTGSSGSTGTGVPGVGGSHASLSFSGRAAAADYLGGIPLIPAGQAEHFNVAIAEGRALVMYKATPEEAPNVEAAFRGAGLRNVKVFKPKETVSP